MLRKQIVVNSNFSGEVSQPNIEKDFIIEAVGTMVVEDKPVLVELLTKNGVLVTDLNTQSELTDATFKAIRDSAIFREDLQDYLVSVGKSVYSGEAEDNSNFLNITKVGAFFNKLGSGIGKVFAKKPQGSAIGNALRNNMDTIIGTGIGILGAKLQADATKGQGQQAIDYTNAQSQLEYLKGQNIQAQQNAPAPADTKKTPKWVLPVAIGGGVLVLGVIIYFAVRKK
jgi:hypothetical protein